MNLPAKTQRGNTKGGEWFPAFLRFIVAGALFCYGLYDQIMCSIAAFADANMPLST